MDKFNKRCNLKKISQNFKACSREPWILARYLERAATDNSGIRKQDLVRVFVTVSNHANGIPVAYNFLRVHWERLKS